MAESKASKTDSLVKAVLVFFISLLSFSIGTFVGKKFSDNQYKTAKLNGGHEEGSEHEVTSTHSGEGETKAEAVNEEQVAKAAEEFVNDEEGSKAPHESPKTEHTATSVHSSASKHETEKTEAAGHIEAAQTHHNEESGETPTKREVAAIQSIAEHSKAEHIKLDKELSHAAANLATDKSPPTEKLKENIKAATNLPSQVAKSPIDKMTVQVASFPTEEEAKKKVTEIRNFGFDSFFTSVSLNGKSWYRVNVGVFSTANEGKKIIAELKEKAQISTGYIQKMVQ